MTSAAAEGRILVVIRQFFPLAAGAETQALRQAKSYMDMGYCARVITARHDKALAAEDIVEGVPVTRLATSRARFIGSLIFLVSLAAYLLLHARRFDAVLAFHLKQAAAVSTLVCRLLGRRIVISDQAAGTYGDIEALRNARFGGLVLWCCRRANAFISGSSDITEELAVAGVAPAKIHFIPNGIPVEAFGAGRDRQSARAALGVPQDAFAVVNVGRHTAQKDLRTLLGAWRIFAPANNRALLVLVGDGNERTYLEELTVKWGLSGSVRFEGWRSNVADYLAAADVFASSSISEGTHIALGEAMAAGLPVIATPVGGARDFVRDGENGLLIPIGDSRELAHGLERLAADAEMRSRMGQAARGTAEERLAQGRTARQHIELLFGAEGASEGSRRSNV